MYKYLTRNNMVRRDYLGSQFRRHSPSWLGKAWQQETEEAGHSVSTAGGSAQLAFSFRCGPGLSGYRTMPLHSGWVFLLSQGFLETPSTHPEECFHGDLKSYQVVRMISHPTTQSSPFHTIIIHAVPLIFPFSLAFQYAHSHLSTEYLSLIGTYVME